LDQPGDDDKHPLKAAGDDEMLLREVQRQKDSGCVYWSQDMAAKARQLTDAAGY
jgi:hypothetical protein